MIQYNKWSILLLALLFTACEKETIIQDIDGNLTAPLNITVSVDPSQGDEAQTRAGGDGQIPGGYRLRYIIEVFVGDRTIPVTREVRTVTSYTDFDFEGVRLPVDNKCTVVCWADFVIDTKGTNLYYNASSLTNITQQTLLEGVTTDLLDAYSGKKVFRIDSEGKTWDEDGNTLQSLSLTLRRPLVRVELQNVELNNLTGISRCHISYELSGTAPSAYNAYTQKVIATQKQKTVTQSVNVDNFNFADYVFMDDVPRTLLIAIYSETGGGKYGKGNLPLSLRLTKPNVKFTLEGTGGNLPLYKITPP